MLKQIWEPVSASNTLFVYKLTNEPSKATEPKCDKAKKNATGISSSVPNSFYYFQSFLIRCFDKKLLQHTQNMNLYIKVF